MCYWAIAHSGSKIAVQPSTDNVTMQIIDARTERGLSVLPSAPSGATERPRLWNASTITTFKPIEEDLPARGLRSGEPVMTAAVGQS